MVDDTPSPLFTSTMRAAVEGVVRLDPVANDSTTAVCANRSQLLNGAFKAVEHVPVSRGKDFEREVILVAAHFADRHTTSRPSRLLTIERRGPVNEVIRLTVPQRSAPAFFAN